MVYSKPNFCHFWVIWAKKLPTSHFWFIWFIKANFKPIQIFKKMHFFGRGGVTTFKNQENRARRRVRAKFFTACKFDVGARARKFLGPRATMRALYEV